jgi:hypothetical protein
VCGRGHLCGAVEHVKSHSWNLTCDYLALCFRRSSGIHSTHQKVIFWVWPAHVALLVHMHLLWQRIGRDRHDMVVGWVCSLGSPRCQEKNPTSRQVSPESEGSGAHSHLDSWMMELHGMMVDGIHRFFPIWMLWIPWGVTEWRTTSRKNTYMLLECRARRSGFYQSPDFLDLWFPALWIQRGWTWWSLRSLLIWFLIEKGINVYRFLPLVMETNQV